MKINRRAFLTLFSAAPVVAVAPPAPARGGVVKPRTYLVGEQWAESVLPKAMVIRVSGGGAGGGPGVAVTVR